MSDVVSNVNLCCALRIREDKRWGIASIARNAVKSDGYADCDPLESDAGCVRFPITVRSSGTSFPSKPAEPDQHELQSCKVAPL